MLQSYRGYPRRAIGAIRRATRMAATGIPHGPRGWLPEGRRLGFDYHQRVAEIPLVSRVNATYNRASGLTGDASWR